MAKAKAPAAWSAVHRHSLASLARYEKEAYLHLRNVVRDADANLVHSAAGMNQYYTLVTIQRVAEDLYDSLADAIADVRAEARAEGHRTLLLELEVLASVASITGSLQPEVENWSHVDQLHAQAAASSFRAAWMAAVTAAVLQTEEGGDVAGAVLVAARRLDSRLARIARTESSRAFNAARDEGVGWLASKHAGRHWMPGAFIRWDATLDAKVCRACRELDGTIVPFGEDFPGGELPGEKHPNCRCEATVIYLPLSQPSTAESGKHAG